jgi:hypothetical protein
MLKMFEFKCPHCDYYVERLVSDAILDAPFCTNGHGKTEKIISTPSFHFADGAGTSAGKAWAFHGKPLWGG